MSELLLPILDTSIREKGYKIDLASLNPGGHGERSHKAHNLLAWNLGDEEVIEVYFDDDLDDTSYS